jgi:hypothetical protein
MMDAPIPTRVDSPLAYPPELIDRISDEDDDVVASNEALHDDSESFNGFSEDDGESFNGFSDDDLKGEPDDERTSTFEESCGNDLHEADAPLPGTEDNPINLDSDDDEEHTPPVQTAENNNEEHLPPVPTAEHQHPHGNNQCLSEEEYWRAQDEATLSGAHQVFFCYGEVYPYVDAYVVPHLPKESAQYIRAHDYLKRLDISLKLRVYNGDWFAKLVRSPIILNHSWNFSLTYAIAAHKKLFRKRH